LAFWERTWQEACAPVKELADRFAATGSRSIDQFTHLVVATMPTRCLLLWLHGRNAP
jgi:hypothetical protein